MRSDDRAQLYTLEGLAAAAILIGLMLYILQSVSVVTPQTETTIDMKLQQKASDVLICLDIENEFGQNKLKDAILGWGSYNNRYPDNDLPNDPAYPGDIMKSDPGIATLDQYIDEYLPSDVLYNLDIHFYDGTNWQIKKLIKHGDPNDNSVMVKKLVTINEEDPKPVNLFWDLYTRGTLTYPQLIEVRLTAWYI